MKVQIRCIKAMSDHVKYMRMYLEGRKEVTGKNSDECTENKRECSMSSSRQVKRLLKQSRDDTDSEKILTEEMRIG
jgi:hypothetical protein